MGRDNLPGPRGADLSPVRGSSGALSGRASESDLGEETHGPDTAPSRPRRGPTLQTSARAHPGAGGAQGTAALRKPGHQPPSGGVRLPTCHCLPLLQRPVARMEPGPGRVSCCRRAPVRGSVRLGLSRRGQREGGGRGSLRSGCVTMMTGGCGGQCRPCVQCAHTESVLVSRGSACLDGARGPSRCRGPAAHRLLFALRWRRLPGGYL